MSELHSRVFESQRDDLEIEITTDAIEGKLPDDLEGTFLRNGPGVQSVGDDALNFFDGHGYVGMLTFAKNERPRFIGKHVRTPVFLDETSAKKQTRRRMFTNMPSRTKNIFDLDLASTAAHDVYAWGSIIVAADERGHFALHPRSLDTEGELRWKGAAPEGHTMCPMPREDPESQRLVAYSVKLSRGRDEITFHELDENWKSERRASYELARSFTFIHDLAFTKNHYVIVEAPLEISVAAALWGKTTVYEAYKWPKGATSSIVLFDRKKDREPPRRIAFGENAIVLHIVNAFERDEKSVIDLVAYDGRVQFASFSPAFARGENDAHDARAAFATTGAITRIVVSADDTITTKKICDVFGELPSLRAESHGMPYRFAYLASPGEMSNEARDVPDAIAFLWFSRVMKLDVESGATMFYDATKSSVVSQPAFAPRARRATARGKKPAVDAVEDDGYVLFWELDLDSQKTSVVILDAQTMAFCARLLLDVFLPPASHARFIT